MEEIEAVVESQRRAVEAAARIANDARDHQSSAIQELQLTLVKCAAVSNPACIAVK